MQRVFVGALKAAVGAYVGAMLLLIVVAALPESPAMESARGAFSSRDLLALFILPGAGLIVLSWWILPVGAVFETFLKPRIVTGTKVGATVRGAFVGLGLGLLTAWIFAAMPDSNVPRKTILTAFAFVPLYCSAWCALYSRANASR